MTVEIPVRMKNLTLDKHGRPIPWFAWRDDKGPDHRVIKLDATKDALRFKKCWVCGGSMPAKWGSFVVGPMCAVNRVSSEPPSHKECAEYSAQACPFLSTPTMTRRENGLPDDKVVPAGVMILRNPGVTLVWTSRAWSTFEVSDQPGAEDGTLFDIGDPSDVSWWHQGRPATREEVLTAIEKGLPTIRAAAEQEGEHAVRMLTVMAERARRLAPAA